MRRIFPRSKIRVTPRGGRLWRNLQRQHEELLRVISEMPDSRLTEQVPGKDYDFYFLLHGTVQHALYHAGQIVLLKRARG